MGFSFLYHYVFMCTSREYNFLHVGDEMLQSKSLDRDSYVFVRFYCPLTECFALLVDDPEHGEALITNVEVTNVEVTNVECPHCCRMFCAQCKVPWHTGVTCAEFKFQRPRKDEQDREDLLPRKVKQESKWQRCPECKIYVERIGDCVFIIYRTLLASRSEEYMLLFWLPLD
ncbi:hypothetical protein ZEAMMB73_Zm00001d035151, partial [Zea mays]